MCMQRELVIVHQRYSGQQGYIQEGEGYDGRYLIREDEIVWVGLTAHQHQGTAQTNQQIEYRAAVTTSYSQLRQTLLSHTRLDYM